MEDGVEMGEMKLLSVNVALPRPVAYRGKQVQTGVFKEPVAGRVMLRRLNLDGDGQADKENHGGPFRAAGLEALTPRWREIFGERV